jgi:hypothetical protein
MERTGLWARLLASLAMVWAVAEGVTLAVGPAGEKWISLVSVWALPSDGGELMLDKLHASVYQLYQPGRCSVEQDGRHRHDRGLRACIAQAR